MKMTIRIIVLIIQWSYNGLYNNYHDYIPELVDIFDEDNTISRPYIISKYPPLKYLASNIFYTSRCMINVIKEDDIVSPHQARAFPLAYIR